MIYTSGNTGSKKVVVYASFGLRLLNVRRYNTKTREVELYILGHTGSTGSKQRVVTGKVRKDQKSPFPRMAVTVKIVLPDSWIEINGKKY